MTTVEISANQARELTDRIKAGSEALWELIKQAWVSGAHHALGYSSWDDYCTREFGSNRIRIPKAERPEEIASMRSLGMSTRAIATATGVSDWTVRNELKEGARNLAPEPHPVTGTDGKTYSAQPQRKPETPPAETKETPSSDEPATPEWEDVGTIPKSRLNDVAPPKPAPRPAPGFNAEDLDELNTTRKPDPAEKEVHKPLDEDYDDPKAHLISLMSHLKKASKEIENAIFSAKHLDSWSQGPVSGDLRGLLDELDDTLTTGGFNAELARLIEGDQ